MKRISIAIGFLDAALAAKPRAGMQTDSRLK